MRYKHQYNYYLAMSPKNQRTTYKRWYVWRQREALKKMQALDLV